MRSSLGTATPIPNVLKALGIETAIDIPESDYSEQSPQLAAPPTRPAQMKIKRKSARTLTLRLQQQIADECSGGLLVAP
jgi:hypothetical protein